jgi:serine protease Do
VSRFELEVPAALGRVCRTVVVLLVATGSVATAFAQDRPTELRDDWFRPEAEPLSLKGTLSEGHVSDRWIYHDLDVARQRARATGKPIVAVFRCVPCGSAPGLDGAVCTAGGEEATEFEAAIRAAGGELDELLDRFVAVRMVKMNGVNRNVFRFDRDVPYVVTFLNADGDVYGRYGTRAGRERKNLPRHNLPSFQQALRRALELHGDRQRVAVELRAKRGTDESPAFAEEMASFVPFPADHNPLVKNCIHCHTVGEAEVRARLAAGKLERRDVWPYPPAASVGLKLDVEDGLRVAGVTRESPAERAGILAGDVLVRLADQPLVSEADVEWALHHAADDGSLPVVVRRGERPVETSLTLAGDWRRNDSHWRASIAPLRPNVDFRPEPYRVKKGAEPGAMGLSVTYPRGPAAAAGLRNGDLLVAVDGRTDLHLESDVLKYLHLDHPEARSVELTIVRNGATSTVTLPVR